MLLPFAIFIVLVTLLPPWEKTEKTAAKAA